MHPFSPIIYFTVESRSGYASGKCLIYYKSKNFYISDDDISVAIMDRYSVVAIILSSSVKLNRDKCYIS